MADPTPTPTYAPTATTATSTKVVQQNGPGGFVYFLAFIGAAVYYIQAADSFWGGVLGFLKALIWPAFLVYDLLRMAAGA